MGDTNRDRRERSNCLVSPPARRLPERLQLLAAATLRLRCSGQRPHKQRVQVDENPNSSSLAGMIRRLSLACQSALENQLRQFGYHCLEEIRSDPEHFAGLCFAARSMLRSTTQLH